MTTGLDEAARSFDAGRFKDAERICIGILVKDPDNIRALNILGGSLARSGQMTKAIQVAERVCFLSPGNAAFYSNLGNLYGATGQIPKAMLVMAHAVTSDTNNTLYQTRFAHLINHLTFNKASAETVVIREAIRICMSNPDIDAASFSSAWHSLLMLDPQFSKFASIKQHGEFGEQAEKVNIKELARPLTDPFFLLGLKSLHAIDARFEHLVTFLRHYFLSRHGRYDAELFLPFLCALAEHCNLVEYVYCYTEKEHRMIEALEGGLDLSATIDMSAMVRIALVSCYKDPTQLDYVGDVEKAAAASGNEAFSLLINNTVSTPAKIREYRDAIPVAPSAGDPVQNHVSSSVAKQYEESPYPRWRHLDMPVLTKQQGTKGRGRNILIAGCGTGHEALNMATYYPDAHILGVDLSVSSLAYGKYKAVEFGIDNVEFMQADILALEELGQQFDLIKCSGVLHHMENPVDGLGKLLACLKPDGIMKIALYSELARQSVVLCRNWIEERGIASTTEGIRAFRQEIMAMDDASPLKDIMNWADFFSMSMCRDLVFHVQEHRVTPHWIKSVLDDLGLHCMSMSINNPFFAKEYASMYPDDVAVKDLDNLHEYEKHNPAVFRDMYQFWCCRRDSAIVENSPAWLYTAGFS